MAPKQTAKGKQGSASMDEEKQQETASKSGHTSHKNDDAKPKQQETDDDAEMDVNMEADEHDESEELDELLELLADDELTELDPEEAIEMIDEWQEIVNESGDKGLKEIGKGLKQLKKALSASNPKPANIAEALTQLGQQTDEYANEAGRGYKTKLHKLGKSLSKAGKSLEQESEA
jgi:hypothetical protein